MTAISLNLKKSLGVHHLEKKLRHHLIGRAADVRNYTMGSPVLKSTVRNSSTRPVGRVKKHPE